MAEDAIPIPVMGRPGLTGAARLPGLSTTLLLLAALYFPHAARGTGGSEPSPDGPAAHQLRSLQQAADPLSNAVVPESTAKYQQWQGATK